LPSIHRLKNTTIFEIADSGGMSISAARGRLIPEVTSQINRTTTVFYSCFVDIYRLSCTVSTLLAFSLLPEMEKNDFDR
jgi:hypothetical protein